MQNQLALNIMEDKEKTTRNQPAFPSTDCETFGEPGMTLRDYFATKAMPHLIKTDEYESWSLSYEQIASFSYLMADAMLKERLKP